MTEWNQRFRFWLGGMTPLPLGLALLVVAGLLVLYACQDTSEITQPSSVTAAVTHKLTVLGTGTGSGKVISTPTGINCTITAGKAGAPGCTKPFDRNVTLTAKPNSGHAFGGWLNYAGCSGTGSCTVKLDADRTITAQFNKGPFTIRITSQAGTGGTGKIKLQAGTTSKTCSITNGTPGTLASCSGTYSAYTTLTLTATPAAGYMFTGWRLPTCGTGKCQFKVFQNQSISATFVRPSPGSPAVQGAWDPPVATPVVAVHAHLLQTGKVLLWGDTGDSQLWSAATGFHSITKPYRIYCTGHGFLGDGRLLVAGGTSAETRGLRSVALFTPGTSVWSGSASMAQGRYYPTLTTLPSGELLALSGHDTNKVVVSIPEVKTPTGWRRLTNAPLDIPNPYYPPVFVAPNGKIFLAGFTQPSQYLDVAGTGQWTPVATRNETNRVLGSAVMYAPGKVLYVGGGKGKPGFDGAPTASAEVIDLNQATPAWRLVGNMQYPRRQLNATILADGTVLVNGGTGGSGFNDQGGAVHAAELWNPVTETWTTMASEMKNRTYHSTALLLPSGRVLSTGSGEGGEVPYANAEFSYQIFTPPYLYNADGSFAARPTITTSPARLSYGTTFSVETPDPGSITRGTLIRNSSVTHGFNQSQLLYPLSFEVTGATTLTAASPTDGKVAPPGPYMLFLINDSGVPSTGKIVMVGP